MASVAVEELPELDVRVVTILWGGDNAERPRVSFTNMSEFEALGMVSAAHEALKILCERHVDLEQDDDDDDDDDDWDDDDDD
jgi:hypothetical protein